MNIFPYSDMVSFWWLPLAAAGLDAVIGDPPRWPHPVRLMGTLLNQVEAPARRMIRRERMAGAAAVGMVLAVTWVSLHALFLLPGILSVTAALYLSFSGLALGQLLREGRAALALLEKGELAAAREAVDMLVSRDVTHADAAYLSRSLAETLAENFNDAFVAPLFWLVVGGPVALWLYKASSTMDSMWGYPHEPWTRFGTAAARLDDILAWLPARVTVFCLRLGFGIQKHGSANPPEPAAGHWPGWAGIRRDAAAMKSPNAGWPMAACAWLAGRTMGGPTAYHGRIVDKPILGPPDRPWTTNDIARLLQGLSRSGIAAALLLPLAGLALHGVIR